MKTHRIARAALAAALGAALFTPYPAAGQTPRTPWGDPDLQGNYTNKYEQGTPLERPDEFEGRKLEDITAEELAQIVQERQDLVLLRTALAGGDPAGNLGGPLHWQDQFDITRGSRPWLVIDPPDGRIPPTTDQARERAAARQAARRGRGNADSWADRSLYDRCITRGLPGSMMPAIYGNSYRIVQAPGFVAIQYEMVHETRIIPLDGRPHVGKEIRGHMGDARGWWDGDTLVVETTNFREDSVYRGANPDALKITERFTRISPDRVEWRVTLEDPTTWTRPWTFSMPLTQSDNEEIVPYECHEGNRAMANILSAARADEQAGRVTDIPTSAEGDR